MSHRIWYRSQRDVLETHCLTLTQCVQNHFEHKWQAVKYWNMVAVKMSKYLLCYITLWNVNKQLNCVQIPGAACTAQAGPFNMLQAGHWKVGDSSVTFSSWPSETSALIPNIHKLKPVHILLLLQERSTDTLIYNVNTKRRKIKGNERIKRENKHMRPAYGWYSMSWSCLLN